MTEYPKYIRDEVVRRIRSHAMPGHENLVKFNSEGAPDLALAGLLIESGFKPPVDPLLREIWDMCGTTHFDDESFDDFCDHLAMRGLTVTVTKTGDA